MIIIKELSNIKSIRRFQSEVLYLSETSIIIESFNILIPYSFNAGDSICFFEKNENNILVYVSVDYNTAYKVIDGSGRIISERKFTFIGKINNLIIESDIKQNVYVSEEGIAEINLKRTFTNSQVKYFDSLHLILCKFGYPTSIDVFLLSSLELLSHLDIAFVSDKITPENIADFYLNRIIGIIDSKVILVINSGQVRIYDLFQKDVFDTVMFYKEFDPCNMALPPHGISMSLELTIDNNRNLMFGLYGDLYYECDLSSKPYIIKSWVIKSELNYNDITFIDQSDVCISDDNCIFFLVQRITNKSKNIGIFERDKKKIKDSFSLNTSIERGDNESQIFYHHPPVRNMFESNGFIYIHFNSKNKPIYVLKYGIKENLNGVSSKS